MKEPSSKKHKNDILLAASVLALALVIYFALAFFCPSGTEITVILDGDVFGNYSLSEDQSILIETKAGNTNRLIIKNKKAWIESADCPDGICVSHKPISKSGELIVCLPHKLIVKISSNSSGGVDMVQ